MMALTPFSQGLLVRSVGIKPAIHYINPIRSLASGFYPVPSTNSKLQNGGIKNLTRTDNILQMTFGCLL